MLTDLEAPAPPPQHWSWKKITLWFLGILIVFVIAILAYDEKLEPYDDLMPTRTTTPDSRTNGYMLLKERWEKLPEADKSDREKMRDMVSGKIPWDDALVAKMRIGRESLSAVLKEALALPEYLTPPALTFDDPASAGTTWIAKPFNYLAMEVLALVRKGDSATALHLLKNLHTLATRLVENDGNLISLLVGASLHSMTANLTSTLLEQGNLDSSQMEVLAKMWQEDLPASEAWQTALKSESASIGDLIQAVAEKRFALPVRPKFSWLLLKKNKTLNRMNQKLRHSGRIAFQLFPSQAAAEAAGWGRIEDKRSSLARYLDVNYVGSQLIAGAEFGSLMPSLTNRMLFEPRAMRVKIAMHRWRAAHPDQWPSSLEDLVPAFLDSVPKDPFNGNPLLWDGVSRIIYGVGSDWKADLPAFKEHSLWFGAEQESPGLRLTRPPPSVPTIPAGGKAQPKVKGKTP